MRLTSVTRPEKCVVGRFRHCVNVERTHTNLHGLAYCAPRLHSLWLLGCKAAQRVTVQKTKVKSSTRENDAIETHKHEIYAATATLTRHPLFVCLCIRLLILV